MESNVENSFNNPNTFIRKDFQEDADEKNSDKTL